MNVGSGQLFIGLVQPPCFIVWAVSETECSSIANSDYLYDNRVLKTK